MEILITAPPYVIFRELCAANVRPVEGAVLIVTVTRDDLVRFPSTVQLLRAQAPWAPIVMSCEPLLLVSPGFAAAMVTAGVRAVVDQRTPGVKVLRPLLTYQGHLADEVTRWIRLTWERSTERSREYIGTAMRHQRGSIDEQPFGRSLRSINRHLRSEGLRSAGWWRGAATCLKTVLALQADPRLTVTAAAFHADYSEVSVFSRACRTYFHDSPGALRRILGWEWLLWHAVQPAMADQAING